METVWRGGGGLGWGTRLKNDYIHAAEKNGEVAKPKVVEENMLTFV